NSHLGCGTPNPYADCFNIGASSGTGTRVSVNNVNPIFGSLNFSGITVVDAATGSANDFTLSTTDRNVVNTPQGLAIPAGFVQYQLMFDAPNVQWDLFGIPSDGGAELSELVDGLQTLWWATADGWNERTAQIRHDYAEGHYGDGPAIGGWQYWGKVYHGQYDADGTNPSIDVFGRQFQYSTAYRQQYTGGQAGADFMLRDLADGAWVLGGLAGFNKSYMNFRGTNSLDYTVGNLGLYASYASR